MDENAGQDPAVGCRRNTTDPIDGSTHRHQPTRRAPTVHFLSPNTGSPQLLDGEESMAMFGKRGELLEGPHGSI